MKVLRRFSTFGNFEALLSDYPEIRERWFQFKNNHIRNETINWLCEKNMELENQRLMPNIEILELGSLEDLPKSSKEELRGFKPAMCMNCQNKENLRARLFLINISPENLMIEKETKTLCCIFCGIFSNFP